MHIGLVRLRCILTKPPAGGDAGAAAAMQLTCREPHARGPGTQFTCFTSTKVQILCAGLYVQDVLTGTQFTCFTSTKVQILTHAPQGLAAHLNAEIAAQQY